MLIKLNCDLLTYRKESIIDINKLNPKEKQYFNRRLIDAKIDNCIEIVDENKKTKQKEKQENKQQNK